MITSYIHPLSHPLLTCLQHDRMRSGKISSSKGGPLGDREAPWETGRLPIYANVHASRQQSQSGQIIIRKTWTANVHIDADTYRNRNCYCYANAKVQPIEYFFFDSEVLVLLDLIHLFEHRSRRHRGPRSSSAQSSRRPGFISHRFVDLSCFVVVVCCRNSQRHPRLISQHQNTLMKIR